MAEGLTKDLIHRYYRDYHYVSGLVKNGNSKFDQLYVANDRNNCSIFASYENKVIYIKYSGNTDVDKIISILEEKFD